MNTQYSFEILLEIIHALVIKAINLYHNQIVQLLIELTMRNSLIDTKYEYQTTSTHHHVHLTEFNPPWLWERPPHTSSHHAASPQSQVFQ